MTRSAADHGARTSRLQLRAQAAADRPPGARSGCSAPATVSPGRRLGTVGQFGAVRLRRHARDPAAGGDRRRYHRATGRVPFGAGYLAVSQPGGGGLTAQRPRRAWQATRTRDRWIGWDEPTRLRHLQRVVNNSRFLVLPWVRVNNLPAGCWRCVAKRLAADWHGVRHRAAADRDAGGVGRRFAGTCYRAANWIELGDASGRVAWNAPMPAIQAPKTGAGRSSGRQRSAPARRGVVSGRCDLRAERARSPPRGRRSRTSCAWQA